MALATGTQVKPEFQADFSGGANPYKNRLLLSDDEVASLTNCFPKIGGGAEARKGYTLIASVSTNQGTGVFEMDQRTPTVLTTRTLTTWYDETMQPRYRLFDQTPNVGDAVYIGAREPFNLLSLYVVLGLSPPTAGNVYEWDYWNGSAWTDFTSAVSENVANSKQMVGVQGEWIFSWATPAGWTPNQVETRGYQYWIRIICTTGLTNMGTDIVQSQRRVRIDGPGRRLLFTADTRTIWDWPGTSVSQVAVVAFATAVRIPRVRGAALNDHFYFATSGVLPLQRWNGSRGLTRASVSNAVANAGLTAPSAAPVLTQPTANPNAYPNGYIGRYRLAFEYGPESILGETMPSASAEITVAGGPNDIRVDFSAAVTQAGALAVNAILVYATYNVAATTVTAERDRVSGFLLVKRVTRDDATWNTGYWEDTFVGRPSQSPISYTNTPPFNPKYVTAGGGRLWIANDINVAWSDIGRGDSWNPFNIAPFPNVRGIFYFKDRLLVFQDEDISTINVPAVGLPDIQYLARGIGCAQPDTICVWKNEVHFVSRDGPARITESGIEYTAQGRVWESATYWAKNAVQRSIAQAVAYQGRVWFGIDKTGGSTGVNGTATIDLNASSRGAWSDHSHLKSGAIAVRWGALAVVHAPLDHALSRQLILCAYAAANFPTEYTKLAILEYGTTDGWTSAETDGIQIGGTVISRAIALGAADRMKQFLHGHVVVRQQKSAGGTTSVQLVSNHGRNNSKAVPVNAGAVDVYSDVTFKITESAVDPATGLGGGTFRDTAPSLVISSASDKGWEIASWLVVGTVPEFSMLESAP